MNNQILLLAIGRRGCGKSRFLRDIVRKTALNQRVVVHDPVRDWVRWGPWPDNVLLFNDECAPDECAHYNAPCTLVLDEVSFVAGTRKTGDDPVVQLALFGRHYGVSILAGSQRPYLISSNFQALVTHLAVFQTTHPRDIAWIQALQPTWNPASLIPGEYYFAAI